MKFRTNLLCALTCSLTVAVNALAADGISDQTPKEPNKAAVKPVAFDLRDIRLLDGAVRKAMERNGQYLRSLDPNRLLHNFRVNAGLPSSAEPLGGWEQPGGELRGHFTGHYLSACAMTYAGTGDEQLRSNALAVVAGLAECQEKLGGGYLSAFPENFFDRLEARKRVWAPYYTIHKILAGLLDVHRYCEGVVDAPSARQSQALTTAKALADWIIARNARLSDAQLQNVLHTEHGGLSESLADLCALTGEAKYLQIAQRFNHRIILEPAANRQDRLTGLHANTQIPKFIGAARQYELTGDEKLKTAATFFWESVVRERSYATGGASDDEYFTDKRTLSQALSHRTSECCNAHNLLKLTRQLFTLDPRAEYADYHERALFNHILASQNPENGMLCHYLPLRAGFHKSYSTPLGWLSCCTGTGIESQAKYGDSIYFHDGTNRLFVNLFIASELNWRANDLKVLQETKFPDEGRTRLIFRCDQAKQLSLHIRRPHWAVSQFEVRVNGQKQSVDAKPGSYAVITRAWKNRDTVEVTMPFTLRTEGFKDNPNRLAFLYGPLVLCAQIEHRARYAVLGEPNKLLGVLKPVAGKTNCFTGPGETFQLSNGTNGAALTFEPFYEMHGPRRYQVYWDVVPQAAMAQGELGNKANP